MNLRRRFIDSRLFYFLYYRQESFDLYLLVDHKNFRAFANRLRRLDDLSLPSSLLRRDDYFVVPTEDLRRSE